MSETVRREVYNKMVERVRERDQENARLRAVNAKLVAACEAALEFNPCICNDSHSHEDGCVVPKLRAALAAAKEADGG